MGGEVEYDLGAANGTRLWSGQYSFSITGSALALTARRMNSAEMAL